jgi:hypothetical protein
MSANRFTLDGLVTVITPGSTGVSAAELAQLVDHPAVMVGIEEELRYPEVGQGQLVRKVPSVGTPVG